MSQVSEAVTVNQADHLQERRFKLYLWVVSYLRPYAGQLMVIVLCGLIAAAGELVIPKMIEYLVDSIIPAKNKSAFTGMLLLLIGIVALSVCASLLRNLLQRAVGSKAARDLQFSVLQKLRKLGFSYYEQRPVGETLSLMNNQVHVVQELYTSFFPDMLELALFVILAVSVMVSGSLKLTLVAVPFFLIYYAVGPSLDRKTAEWNERMNEQRMDYNRKIHESVSGIRDFRAFSAEDWDLQRGLRLYQTVTDTTLKWVFFIHTRWSIRRVFFDAGAVALFVFGYWFIRNQTLTVGAFLSFFPYLLCRHVQTIQSDRQSRAARHDAGAGPSDSQAYAAEAPCGGTGTSDSHGSDKRPNHFQRGWFPLPQSPAGHQGLHAGHPARRAVGPCRHQRQRKIDFTQAG
ncbi:ABC transporter transmembrane domain-containing protein [Paenibacillus zanthoxyli]|uniref:ABC transporter transmembrane domain-containing protein n=1 Tax=Paenibacillus zanthoxyli TaxID=369399 RepID=UPI00047162F9|nr:ABC transporter ATP-binding protein [Paenibacillus zanthoxyli]